MGSTDYLPSRESDLATYVRNFKTVLDTSHADVGVTDAQAAAFGVVAEAFLAAFAVARGDATRTPASIKAKDGAKNAIIRSLRQLAGIIQKFPGTTDEKRVELSLTVHAQSRQIGAPTSEPGLEVKSRLGPVVTLVLHDKSGEGRGKPPGVQGARVYSFVGPNPPAKTEDWTFEGQVTRTMVDVSFGEEIAPGTVVWFTAQWYNPRGETGPGSAPISTFIAGGSALNKAA